MLGRVSSAALALGLAACVADHASGNGSPGSSLSCPDASAPPLVPPRDAGPACVAPGDAACPIIDSGTPDPAHWGCYSDRDCAIFPQAPYCEGFGCVPDHLAVTCVANTPQQNSGYPNPEVSHTHTGSNGTFADHCDAEGNLVDYECEAMPAPCGPPPNGCWDRPLIQTGRVIPLPQTVDCSGTCRNARCDGRCPQQGDQITFEGLDADGRQTVRNDTDGRTYACSADMAACTNAPLHQTGFVHSLGLTDLYCTGAAFGSIGVVLDGVPTPQGLDTCLLSCSIVPALNCGPS